MFQKGVSGNPKGRPPRPEVQELRDALLKAKTEKNKSFIEHYVALAYEDKNVAIALANKVLPELKSIDMDDEMLKAFEVIVGVRNHEPTDNRPKTEGK